MINYWAVFAHFLVTQPTVRCNGSLIIHPEQWRAASKSVVNVISLRFPIVFKVGSRGPCPLGQLVVFEKYSGKSYRGECGCSPGYNQNYWPETGQCFEWYTQGPCKDSFLFQYNRESGMYNFGGKFKFCYGILDCWWEIQNY